MATTNLWPAEITADSGLEGPVVVLKEQAALLGQATKNLVEAQVESLPTADEGRFFDRFVVYSDVINYRYELFSINYPFEFYPVDIHWAGYASDYFHEKKDDSGAKMGRTVFSREELEQELKNIFSHPKTLRIIQAMVARSRE